MRGRYYTHAALAAALSLFSAACGPRSTRTETSPLTAYVEAAKADAGRDTAPEGSLWTGRGRRANLYRDPKAFEVSDVVTILVQESTSALASADAKASKESETTAGASSLFGLQGKVKELPSMVGSAGSNTFKGQGATTRQTTLETTLTARVVDVLPNGYLLVEGTREVKVNNENQTVFLNGVVRPEDISRDNTVLSSSVAQMTVRVQGKGLVSQPLKPGWLQRIMFGILPF